jgi:hypothetical protein
VTVACGAELRGLLDSCDQPECLTADLDIDHAISQGDDQ